MGSGFKIRFIVIIVSEVRARMSSQSPQPVPTTGITNRLLTGAPGCGKTTVLARVAERLGDLRLASFLTVELREHAQRVGFEAVGLGGGRGSSKDVK
jgi:hypothetical protein